jgi:DNA-binding transcriptional LysR family regulator
VFAGGVEGSEHAIEAGARYREHQQVRRILPGCEPPPSALYAVYPSNRLISAKVRAFVDHLARRIGRMPYWDKGL